jgi:hypothetical protein
MAIYRYFTMANETFGVFRLFTSQMIVNGTVKPKEIVKAFGVPMFWERGVEGFYEAKIPPDFGLGAEGRNAGASAGDVGAGTKRSGRRWRT